MCSFSDNFIDGIAASVTIGVMNYVLLGFEFAVDGYYIPSFEIWLACTVVFFGSGTVGYTLLEYRLGHKELVSDPGHRFLIGRTANTLAVTRLLNQLDVAAFLVRFLFCSLSGSSVTLELTVPVASFFFFGGLGIPVSQAILAHLFSYNISWSATIKEVQRSNFFKEIPKIIKRYVGWLIMPRPLLN
jgi:hypothetical protein